MDKQKYWFFGSKLNSVLLLILIILMVFALRFMYQDKEKYLSGLSKEAQDWAEVENRADKNNTNQIEGDKESLISFSIKPGQEVSGVMRATGVLRGGYFFEGNLPVSILDANKNPTSYGPGHGQATTDWMTNENVSFYIDFDFNTMPKGKAYIKLTQDDPSGGESGRPIQSVIIPIVIK